MSEFLQDLRQPNDAYLNASPAPLLERNPLLFWKGLCVILACIVFVLLVSWNGGR